MPAPGRRTIAQSILARIREDEGGRDDWRACGSEVYASMQICSRHIESSEMLEGAGQDLSRLFDMAEEAIKSVHHTKVQREWRRLYTDVCIFGALAAATDADGADGVDDLLAAIRHLDMAIIVCGAPGLERLEMVHKLIALLQQGLPLPARCLAGSLSTPIEVRSDRPDPPAYCLASQRVKKFPSMPSLTDYTSRNHLEPFIVRKFASTWPAIRDKHRKWANGSYLAQVGGPGRVVPVEIGWQYTEADWYQDVIPWQDFLEASGWTTNADQAYCSKEAPRYLAQHNLFRQFPALEADIVLPDIVYSCPSAPAFFPQYKAPIDEDGFETAITNAWIGPGGTTTPAHFDPYYNAYVQVVGQKLVWIAPPDVFAGEKGDTLLDGNSSTLPVFDEKAKDTLQSRWVRDKATSTTLGPGDLLVLPPGWFHAMRSLSRSFSVSMWY